MLCEFYRSFPLERERLQLPMTRLWNRYLLLARRRLAVKIWGANARKDAKAPPIRKPIKQKLIAPRKQVSIGTCGSVAQALYRYLDRKYRISQQLNDRGSS